MFRVILCLEVRESYSLYVHIHIFCVVAPEEILHTVICYQVFLPDTNNLHTVVWFQIFLSIANNPCSIIWVQVNIFIL